MAEDSTATIREGLGWPSYAAAKGSSAMSAMQRHWLDPLRIATAMLSRARFSQAKAKSGFDKHSTAKAKHVMAKR